MQARFESESLIAKSLKNHNIQVNSKFKDNAPLINQIPEETKLAILLLLTDKGCMSLFCVSSDWMNFLISVTDGYLNSVKDKIELIMSFDAQLFIANLTNFSNENSNGRGEHYPQLQTLMGLKTEMTELSSPLAKFLQCQKRIKEALSAIAASYPLPKFTQGYFSIFGTPDDPLKQNRLYCFLSTYRKDNSEFNSPQTNWFKLAVFCAGFSVNNPTGKILSNAVIDLKKLEKPQITAETQAIISQNPFYTEMFKALRAQQDYERFNERKQGLGFNPGTC